MKCDSKKGLNSLNLAPWTVKPQKFLVFLGGGAAQLLPGTWQPVVLCELVNAKSLFWCDGVCLLGWVWSSPLEQVLPLLADNALVECYLRRKAP